MNEEVSLRKYFKKILNSMGITLLWMLVNSTLGIMFNFAFFEGEPTMGNYIFYTWLGTSLLFLLYFLYKVWK